MIKRVSLLAVVCFITAILFFTCKIKLQPPAPEAHRVLVFSKTEGYRHTGAIGAGQVALMKMGQESGFSVDTTEDSRLFTDENLRKYGAIVFLNVSGAVFSKE